MSPTHEQRCERDLPDADAAGLEKLTAREVPELTEAVRVLVVAEHL